MMKARLKLVRRVVFIVLCCSAMPVSSSSDLTELADRIVTFWVQQETKAPNAKGERCWKKSKARDVSDASQLIKEIDVGRWLLAIPVERRESNYEVAFQLSISGLEQRLSNSGYAKTAVLDESGNGVRQIYVNEALHRLEFAVLDPVSAKSILLTQESDLFEMLSRAFEECKNQSRFRIADIARLAYLLIPYMSDQTLVLLINHLLDDYTRAYEAEAIRKWTTLSRLSQVVSLVHPRRKTTALALVSPETRRYLTSDLKSRIDKSMAKPNQNESFLVIKLWRYVALQQALHVDQTILDLLETVEHTSADPLLQYTLLDTVRLLVLASDSGWVGDLQKASHIVRAMILFELGTSNTGLRLTRPINDNNVVVTPYPLWLALVPPYVELTGFMIEHSGQLTAEKYKNSRTFSRDQYVSGTIEQEFWQLFENVVN